MSLLLLIWLVVAFTVCGIGAWLVMAGVILGMVPAFPKECPAALRGQAITASTVAVFGLVLFVAGIAMLARVFG